MHDLFTPGFKLLYDACREQSRIDSVGRMHLQSADGTIPHELLHGYPVVFSNHMFPKKSELDLVDLLDGHCPGLRIQVRRASFESAGQYLTERELEEVPMADYLRGLRSAIGNQQSTVKYAGNQKLPSSVEQLLKMAAPVRGVVFEQPVFWLGGMGSATPLHKDSTDNFAFQICGTKRWILFPVRDIPFLYMERPLQYTDFATSQVDPKNPRLDRYPLYSNAKSVVVDVKAGEMLYLPAGWAHYVENVSMSLMVNYWVSRR